MNSESTEGVESQPQATLCSNGCGFFANVGTSGKCSKCYRETEKAQQSLDAVAQKAASCLLPPASTPTPSARPSDIGAKDTPCAKEAIAESSAAPVVGSPGVTPPPANPCRCQVETCRKRLGLTGFKCRCGHSFCGTHRHAESHNCTFDYKTFERLKIADSNPLVQASKIQKI